MIELICLRSLYAGFYNGGPVSLVYGLLFTLTGVLALAASLSEMASMCPISGAQYHWTYMFAPKKSAAFITWMQGKKLKGGRAAFHPENPRDVCLRHMLTLVPFEI